MVNRDNKHTKTLILIDLGLPQNVNDGGASFSPWPIQVAKPSSPRDINAEYTEQEPRVQGPSDLQLVMHHKGRGL